MSFTEKRLKHIPDSVCVIKCPRSLSNEWMQQSLNFIISDAKTEA